MDIDQIFAYTNKNMRSIIVFDKTKTDFSDNGFILTEWAQFKHDSVDTTPLNDTEICRRAILLSMCFD